MLRGSRHCPECSEICSTSRLDPGHSIGGQTQKETGQVRSRWFGQDLSEMPDSGVSHTHDNRTGSCFTNTAVPRFDGRGCWKPHLLIVQAIVKSNGWSEATAALQLFAHLDGEALNVALLMPVEERKQWEDLSNGLSEYHNSPRRLAVFRRRFESVSRSSYVCHRVGNPCSTWIRRLGQACP